MWSSSYTNLCAWPFVSYISEWPYKVLIFFRRRNWGLEVNYLPKATQLSRQHSQGSNTNYNNYSKSHFSFELTEEERKEGKKKKCRWGWWQNAKKLRKTYVDQPCFDLALLLHIRQLISSSFCFPSNVKHEIPTWRSLMSCSLLEQISKRFTNSVLGG